MTTLADFLLARIAEDEVAATRRSPAEGYSDLSGRPLAGDVWVTPARVLAECEAKRRLLVREDNLICTCWSPDPSDVPTDWRDRSRVLLHHCDCACLAIAAILALPYAAHPDYREEWRP